jgi:hypothetical protein
MNPTDIRPRADGSIAVWTEKPKECAECHRLHFFFVSRDGRTRCVFCDDPESLPGQGVSRTEESAVKA